MKTPPSSTFENKLTALENNDFFLVVKTNGLYFPTIKGFTEETVSGYVTNLPVFTCAEKMTEATIFGPRDIGVVNLTIISDDAKNLYTNELKAGDDVEFYLYSLSDQTETMLLFTGKIIAPIEYSPDNIISFSAQSYLDSNNYGTIDKYIDNIGSQFKQDEPWPIALGIRREKWTPLKVIDGGAAESAVSVTVTTPQVTIPMFESSIQYVALSGNAGDRLTGWRSVTLKFNSGLKLDKRYLFCDTVAIYLYPIDIEEMGVTCRMQPDDENSDTFELVSSGIEYKSIKYLFFKRTFIVSGIAEDVGFVSETVTAVFRVEDITGSTVTISGTFRDGDAARYVDNEGTPHTIDAATCTWVDTGPFLDIFRLSASKWYPFDDVVLGLGYDQPGHIDWGYDDAAYWENEWGDTPNTIDLSQVVYAREAKAENEEKFLVTAYGSPGFTYWFYDSEDNPVTGSTDLEDPIYGYNITFTPNSSVSGIKAVCAGYSSGGINKFKNMRLFYMLLIATEIPNDDSFYWDPTLEDFTNDSPVSEKLGYNRSIYITTKQFVLDILTQMAWEFGCRLSLDEGLLHIDYLPLDAAPSADDTITTAQIIAGTIKITTRNAEDIFTQLTFVQPNGMVGVYAKNTELYGRKDKKINAIVGTSFEKGSSPQTEVAKWWLSQYAYAWRRVSFTGTIACLIYDVFDIVDISCLAPYIIGTTGTIIGRVISTSFNSQEQTVGLTIEIPFLQGDTSAREEYWTGDIVLD